MFAAQMDDEVQVDHRIGGPGRSAPDGPPRTVCSPRDGETVIGWLPPGACQLCEGTGRV
ncbi:hypothetical protein AB0J52_13015 [Spirillospora sp. NPDC049652]